MRRPPLIGITAGNDPQMPGHYVLRWDYVESVAAVGGIPVILAPGKAAEEPHYIECFDALVLSGGNDLRPETYGQDARTEIRDPCPERDAFELRLTSRALELGTPVLAICRGMQVLNVTLGGTLLQDLPTELGEQIRHDDLDRPRYTIAHDVGFESDSRLAELLSAERIAVNSFHHQAIDDLATDLRAIAWADDGVIEGVELPGRPVLGVQWHPECFWENGIFLPLFAQLVEAARAR